MKRDISGWVILLLVCLFSCKTTRHIQKEKQSVVEVQKKDSTGKESSNVATIEHTEEQYKRDIDTTLNVKVKGSAKVNKPEKGKTDSAAVYDSLGNKLGVVRASLNVQGDALILDIDLNKQVTAKVHEEGSKKSNKKTNEEKHSESAIHAQNQRETSSEVVHKDVERKTDVWAWIKWIAGVLALLALILNYKRIWAWLLTKIKK